VAEPTALEEQIRYEKGGRSIKFTRNTLYSQKLLKNLVADLFASCQSEGFKGFFWKYYSSKKKPVIYQPNLLLGLQKNKVKRRPKAYIKGVLSKLMYSSDEASLGCFVQSSNQKQGNYLGESIGLFTVPSEWETVLFWH